jgi:hypothetical protein
MRYRNIPGWEARGMGLWRLMGCRDRWKLRGVGCNKNARNCVDDYGTHWVLVRLEEVECLDYLVWGRGWTGYTHDGIDYLRL